VFFVLPIGDLALPLRVKALGEGERLTLACCVGYPLAATLRYLWELLGLREGFWMPLLALAAIAAVRRLRARASASETRPGSWRVAAALALLVPGLLWILMRDAAVFEPTPEGLLYDHPVDYLLQLAWYWEFFRGVPPAELPNVAGLPAPSYHVLGFMPGLFFMRDLGLDALEVQHFAVIALRLLLLMGGLYLCVRLLTDSSLLAIAGLLSAFGVLVASGHALEGRIVDAASPFSFFLASESGGSAIVVWSAIGALLLLSERDPDTGRRSLMLASLLAGLSYGFKAQSFLLLAAGYCAALVLVALRDRRRDLISPLLLTLAAALAVFLSWRAPLTLGVPQLAPGLFAQLYVLPSLSAERLGSVGEALSRGVALLAAPLDGMLLTLLGVWKMLGLSPFVPAWLATLAWTWRRRGLAELAFGFGCLFALPLGYLFSVRAIDGVVSPYEFIQAAQGLAFLAAIVNVVALSALLCRLTRRANLWTAAVTGLAALAVVPLLLTGKTVRTPHRSAVLDVDEVCGLLYLRNFTPLDAVVASARGEGVPPTSAGRRLNYHPLVGGLAGRRTLLEYFWREVDPGTDRVRAIRRLFATTDAVEGERILRRFGVTHVLEYAGRPLAFTSPELVPVYGRGGVRVYRFGGGSVAPPPRLPPAFGMACEAPHS
jgi:hypothetical protein